jgi:hypothetical protein
MSNRENYHHEAKEQFKKSDYFSDLYVYEFECITDGVIFYKYVDMFGEYEILISFSAKYINSIQKEQEFDEFDNEQTDDFQYTIRKIEKTIIEES